jgi:OmcA/MtrC family decaheme c-type cytochrome
MYLWTQAGVEDLDFHNLDEDCAECHRDGGFATNAKFSDLHSGYDKHIYDANGVRYEETYTVSIDSVAYDGVADTLTVEYSASDADVSPQLLVSFYGWDTKDFIVPSHWRDASQGACSATRGCRFEYRSGDTNPLFTEDALSAAPNWKVTANLAAYVAELTDDIPTLIDNMDVTKIEVTVLGSIDMGLEDDISLTAATATYDLMAGGLIDNYFQGTNAIAGVDAVTGENMCNACHDQLSVTFHSGRGRAGEMTVCRNCHASTNAGSHMEMQSRSIEGYVHAIHSFQDFDVDESFEEFDAVKAKRYDAHINHLFPRFTPLACEACHNPGTYNVPDQSKSMPGVLSQSSTVNTWYDMEAGANSKTDKAVERAARNIGEVPEYVVGPASKACGGCHRAQMINEDLAGDLAAFNAHTDAFGTLVVNDDDDEILFGIMKKIMTWFE